MQSDVAQLPLADRLWAWFETNKKPALWGAAVVVAVGLISWFLIWQHDEKEATASDALSNITAAQFIWGPRPDLASAYQQIAAKYAGSSAAVRASLMAASALFTESKYAEAQAQFDKFTREHHDSPLVGQAMLGIATCLDAQGKTPEAVTAYKELIERHPNETFIPQAKFSLALLYEKQNKAEQARALYEEVERSVPYGYLGTEAGMRIEELNAKNPTLANTPPAPPTPQFKLEKK
jgi:predicted negative regulator of RcsB-dependent stress response